MILRVWYQRHILSYLLLPFSWLYRFIFLIRQNLYRRGIFKIHRVAAPVVVVGNLTVGGTGKTPFVIALVEALKKAGRRPGVVSRGYLNGEEAVLIKEKTCVPVVVNVNRVRAAKKLIDDFACDVVVSDDGLQHTALARDIEIALIHGNKKFGNGFLLPAGPLREPISRLQSVDLIVVNAGEYPNAYHMRFVIDDIVSVVDENKKLDIHSIQNRKIYAVAGIAHPDHFFDDIRKIQANMIPVRFSDHHDFTVNDIDVEPEALVIMTEKDAVKCRLFADHRHFVARGQVIVDPALMHRVMQLIRNLHGHANSSL